MIVDVATAARELAASRIVAYPTETVYGLGVDPGSERALSRLRELKGLAHGRGLSLLVADLDALEALVPVLPARARNLARRFWPGPLTLVVRVDDPSLAPVASELGVGFRCSPHPTAAALARASGPIVATSCNPSGDPPCVDAAEVERVFGAELPVAGGQPAGGGAPSTVVAVTAEGSLKLLREGALAYREIEESEPA